MKSKKERKEKRQSIFKEFIAFINKGNAIALAIGVILGGAFNAIVTAINKNIISPIIALCLGDTDLTNSLQTVLKYRTADATDVANGLATTVGEQIPGIVISWGAFIQSVIDFLLIAIILFAMVKITSSIVNKAKAAGEKLVKKNKKDVKYNPYYNFIIEGTGDIIIGQMPEAGESIIEGGTVILYT